MNIKSFHGCLNKLDLLAAEDLLKRNNRLKVLWFDHNGYCILYKRLHGALFEVPEPSDTERPLATIDPRALAQLLRGVAK